MDWKALVAMIEGYLAYYNTKRLQRNLEVMTPSKSLKGIWLHKITANPGCPNNLDLRKSSA
jgi:transcriptional regulator of met regulon